MQDNSAPDQISFASELARKATHMGALVIPVGYQLTGISKEAMLYIMGSVFLFTVFVDIGRMRGWGIWKSFFVKIFGRMIRKHESTNFTGAFYILLSAFFTILFFSKPIAIAALAFIIIGDSLAALIGRRYGRHKIGNKSIEGSLACLGGTLIVAFSVPGLGLIIGVAGAFVAAVVEALPLKIDDNLSVPLLAGVVMMSLEKILLFA